MWIAITMLGIAAVAVVFGLAVFRSARLVPVDCAVETQTLTRRQVVLFGGGLGLMGFLVIAFTPADWWFLAPILFVAAWVPQASAKSLSPSSSVAVAAIFAAVIALTATIRAILFGL